MNFFVRVHQVEGDSTRAQIQFHAGYHCTCGMTDAFNTKLGGMVFDTAHIVQYFAPLMFQTAVNAMYPGKAPKLLDAILDVAVLNSPTLVSTNDPPHSPTCFCGSIC